MRLLYVLLFLPLWLVAQPKGEPELLAPRQRPTSIVRSGPPTVIGLNDTTRFLAVGRQLSILEDKTGQLTFEQVRQRTDFKPGQSESFQYGFSSSAYWFRFELMNTSQENTRHWLLGLLDAATLDYVDLYLVYPQGPVRHLTGGLKRPYVDRGFFATTPFFRVELPTNTSVTAYFRIKSSLSMFGKVTVWDEYYNLSKGRVIIFAIWMFLGLFILRSLNNFVLARFIPDPQFRYYAVCTFLLYLSTLSRTGVYPILFSSYPQLLDWMHYGMGRLLPLGLATWMYTLLDNRMAFRPLRWLLLGIMGVEVVGIFIALFVQTVPISYFYACIATLVYTLFFLNLFLIWLTPQRTRYHFVLPIVLCTIPFFLFQLQSLSLITYRPVISQLALLALAIEMVSMSLVLGRIVQSYIKDRITTANALIQEKVEVDKLQELDALKTQFFTNISHEFRTPLTLILGPIEQAIQDYAHDTRFPLIQRNANRLLSLINQLLDLSKLEAGQLKPEPEQGDMAAFFRTLASSFESLAESRHIQFRFTQNEPTCQAKFDRDKIEKIVTNLLANAFKFTPAGNTVQMTIQFPESESADALRVIVEDTGIGIAPHDLPHIFERFYQRSADTGSVHTGSVPTVVEQNNRDGGDAAYRSRPYEGTGIGLALVNELVRVLNGSIGVTSNPGVGTTFTVTLPLVQVREPTAPVAPTLISRNRSLFQQTPPLDLPLSRQNDEVMTVVTQRSSENVLLIIDDNADIRAYVRSVFESDYQIIEAVDGQDGLEQATATLPNIVICDLMMPRLDGFGFCKALKTQPATSHIPVVMLTAKATSEDRVEGFKLGADDYLTKPFNRVEIVARVHNLILQRQRLYQWFSTHELTAPANEPVGQELLPALLTSEKQFIDQLTGVVHQHIDEPAFGVERLAEAVNLSRSQLHRKLKVVLHTSPVNFIRKVRLVRAAELLAGGEENVSQVAYAVGIDNLSYFSKVFQEQYSVLPSHYKTIEKAMNKS